MSTIEARNSSLRVIHEDIPLDSDFSGTVAIDFRDSKTGAIQIVRNGGDKNDGTFSLKWSLLCDLDTFVPLPDSELKESDSDNLGWLFQKLPFRYLQVNYTTKTDSTGTFSVYATGKR